MTRAEDSADSISADAVHRQQNVNMDCRRGQRTQQRAAALHPNVLGPACILRRSRPTPMAVRLFVGGLPLGVTPEELAARFAPFGEVTECSLAAPKAYAGVDDTVDSFPRDFGHVSLRPKDEASLRKCISAYNGCKWRGGVLRCSLARQQYAERLAEERAGGGGSGGNEAAPAGAAEVRSVWARGCLLT